MLLPEADRKDVIDVEDVEKIVALMARIPPKSVSKDDREVIRNLERDLRTMVFGQDQAITVLSDAIKMARAGLRDSEKPIGCYLFSGPTGVGKTEVARQLAKTLGVDLKRFDMSEYMERHAVSRLIGAPPGYVGYEQGGLLTDAVDQQPQVQGRHVLAVEFGIGAGLFHDENVHAQPEQRVEFGGGEFLQPPDIDTVGGRRHQ